MRAAIDPDVDAICRICAEGWRDTYAGMRTSQEIDQVVSVFYAADRVRGELAPSGRQWGGWLVAEDENGDVVAAGAGGLTAPGIGEIYVLYADPSRRREGAGSSLLAALTAWQLEQGAREQWVSVEEDNHKGVPFYERHGFALVGKRDAYEMSGSSLRYMRKLENTDG